MGNILLLCNQLRIENNTKWLSLAEKAYYFVLFVCLFVYVVVVLEKNEEDNHLKCLNEKYTNLPGLSV